MTAALEGGEWSAARPGRTLPPRKTRYPLYRRLGGPQGRSGRAENLVPTGIRSRIVHPVAQSLYQLSYPSHLLEWVPGLFSGVERPGCGVDRLPPSRAKVEERGELFLFLPSEPAWPCYVIVNFLFL